MTTRRDFLKGSSQVAAGAAVASVLPVSTETLKIPTAPAVTSFARGGVIGSVSLNTIIGDGGAETILPLRMVNGYMGIDIKRPSSGDLDIPASPPSST